MLLVERFWKGITGLLGVFTLSPVTDDIHAQTPLDVALQKAPAASPVVENVIIPTVASGIGNDHGDLFFTPPGTLLGKKNPFTCNYSRMVDEGWESCSTPLNRKCWLRKKDGSEPPFDIYTDYETRKPKGQLVEYDLTLYDWSHSADGQPFKNAKLFNKEYPGPWIEACWGDTIRVKVRNELQWNGTSVHWHGIRQLNTMHMDGVNGVTQCPIAKGDYMIYEFETWQYGSSWYHSHYSVQYADGAHGGLTIHGPTSENWDEAVSPPLIMTDWNHDSAFNTITWEFGEASKTLYPSILLDGRGNVTRFNNDVPSVTEVKKPFTTYFKKAQPGERIKRYLLRIINTSFDTTFLFSIDNHRMVVVEADFVPIDGYSVTQLIVGIGQRYDVIVDAWPEGYLDSDNQTMPVPSDGNFWIRTDRVPSCFVSPINPKTSPGYERTGILRYDSTSTTDPVSQKWPTIKEKIDCNDPSVFRYYDIHPVHPWTVGPAVNSFPEWFRVGGPWPPLPDYPLSKWYLGVDASKPIRVDYSSPTFLRLNHPGNWSASERMESFPIKASETDPKWVYLVLETNGTDHPIHLHGHDFAIIDAQARPFDPANYTLTLNNPPRRDVVMLPSNGKGGYVIIAFKIDNPGAWLVHCHIAFHISEGLGMQILEDQRAAAARWPANDKDIKEAQRICKNWNTWVNNSTNRWNETEHCDEKKWGWEKCFQNDSGV